LVIFAFQDSDRASFLKLFEDCNNVDIIAPGSLLQIDFPKFNGVLRSIIPALGGKKK
jgi:hypothetical protein